MQTALPQPMPSAGSSRLSAWTTISLLAHLAVLAASGGIPRASISFQATEITVDIVRLNEEERAAPSVVVQDVEPTIEENSPQGESAQTALPSAQNAPTHSHELFPDPYYNHNDVEVRAEPVNEVLLYYPPIAYQRRLAGVVEFKLFINARGELDKIEFVGATPPGVFEEAAWEAVRKLQFNPAMKNGRPVKSKKTIGVVFDPNDDHAKPPAKRADFSGGEK